MPKRNTLTLPNPLNGGDTDLRVQFTVEYAAGEWTDNLQQYAGEAFGGPEEIEVRIYRVKEGHGGEYGWWEDVTAQYREDADVVQAVKEQWTEREHTRWQRGATRLSVGLAFMEDADAVV